MIRYRKSDQPRILRFDAPEPPFGAATAILPYSFPRSVPLALDYVRLIGSGIDRTDVTVCSDFTVETSRGPVLVDATEAAELVYRRGARLHQALRRDGAPVIQLISTAGIVPEITPIDQSVVVLCSWPLEMSDLDALARELSENGLRWGLAIPILFPSTTDLSVLEELADLAATHRAEFLIGIRFDMDPVARRVLATSFRTDEETYTTLFDEGMESVTIATERHIAALAVQRSLADFCIPPEMEKNSNWTAAMLIAIAGYRRLQMQEEAELGWDLVRSARFVAQLPKPITRIAEAANLSIIEALPPAITEALTEWLETGRARWFEEINSKWRLRRDYAPE